MKRIVYFAYGSNLDRQQMARRCPSAMPMTGAVLPNHQLAFAGHSAVWGGGVATVRPKPGAHVNGMLYLLADTDLARLDQFEGAPYTYERRSKIVVDEAGKRRRVHVYTIAEDLDEPALPSRKYLDVIERAYERLGFDRAPLVEAAGAVAQEAVDRVGSTSKRTRVFVYGTLLAGEGNHHLLRAATFVDSARTEARFRMMGMGAFPAIVPDGSTAIVGEVYEVDGETLARLDSLEGHPGWYTRTAIPLDGAAEAQAYLLRPTQVTRRKVIPSGDWRQYNREMT